MITCKNLQYEKVSSGFHVVCNTTHSRGHHFIPSPHPVMPKSLSKVCPCACLFPLPRPYLLRARVVPLGPRCSTTDPSIFEFMFFHLNNFIGWEVSCVTMLPRMDRSNPKKQPPRTTVRHSCKPTTVIMKFNRVTWSVGLL